jgi:perosamine synthetase
MHPLDGVPTGPSLAPPHRLDLEAKDLVDAVLALTRRDETAAHAALLALWGDDALACLSVRSALCAFLEVMQGYWMPGDEVLCSALTITDMPRLIRAFGFVPVPVPVDPASLAPEPAALRAALGPRSRAVLVAHLFGADADLDDTVAFARAHGLLVLEDAAQSFRGLPACGHTGADLSFFSFGTLKTRTALGGAIVRVREPTLRAAMTTVMASWPAQSTSTWGLKLARAALFLVAQQPLVYGGIARVASRCGRAIGDVVRAATRGFPAAHDEALLALLRRRPCPPLLAFLRVRLLDTDGGGARRLQERAIAGEALLAALLERQPATPTRAFALLGAQAGRRSHWLLPLRTRRPAVLREALLARGLDASGASNITAVGGTGMDMLVNELVFVPAYPELPSSTRAALHAVVLAHIDHDDDDRDDEEDDPSARIVNDDVAAGSARC